jgi:hypothetical protein
MGRDVSIACATTPLDNRHVFNRRIGRSAGYFPSPLALLQLHAQR